MLLTVTVPTVAWLLLPISSARLAKSACTLPSAIGGKLAAETVSSSITRAFETRRMLVTLANG